MSARRPLVRLGQAVLDLLFPARCAACGRYGQFLCGSCADAMPRALPPRCPLCWQPQRAVAGCWSCRRRSPAFAAARAPFVYDGVVRSVVHAFKYGYVSALAASMASPMADCLRQLCREPGGPATPEGAVLVPVPLFRWRERSRGYNQAALLARELGRLCDLPVAEGALVRRRNTPPQAQLSGATAAAARRGNVERAFAAGPQPLPAGAVALLVDDVMTSGATLDACARALREAGAGAVFALVFAREGQPLP